ncbi:hypothetical protein [Anaerosacchariphilus polymeriproducens]|nr:hypothetical protein [Anaerosacchariphilus polymeriproducens]
MKKKDYKELSRIKFNKEAHKFDWEDKMDISSLSESGIIFSRGI